jgi:hypothetical protein
VDPRTITIYFSCLSQLFAAASMEDKKLFGPATISLLPAILQQLQEVDHRWENTVEFVTSIALVVENDVFKPWFDPAIKLLESFFQKWLLEEQTHFKLREDPNFKSEEVQSSVIFCISHPHLTIAPAAFDYQGCRAYRETATFVKSIKITLISVW